MWQRRFLLGANYLKRPLGVRVECTATPVAARVPMHAICHARRPTRKLSSSVNGALPVHPLTASAGYNASPNIDEPSTYDGCVLAVKLMGVRLAELHPAPPEFGSPVPLRNGTV